MVLAMDRADVDPKEVDDVIAGTAMQHGFHHAIGRNAALGSGLPTSVAGMSVDRQCASGLMAIATATTPTAEQLCAN
jgi:acetyl-CoA C-acetyltransferase